MEPSLPEESSATDNNLSSSILLIVVVVLAVAFFVSVLLHVLLRCLLRTPASLYLDRGEDGDDDIDDTNVTAMQGRLRQLFRLHDSGVDQSFIDTLPVFPYGAVVAGGGGGGLEDPFDCAVCLCGFEPDDKLRLLTACSHAFHVGCIDTWLLAHSTCPLCRSSLLDCFVGSAACDSSRRLSVASSVVSSVVLDDDKLVGETISEAEEEVVEVRLGKFRNVDGGGSGRKELNDERRCYSMGSYEYIMSESSSLRVAVKPTSKRRLQLAMSECDCHSRRVAQLGFLKLGFEHDSARKRSSIGGGGSKRESFSVSKIWLRKESRPTVSTNGAESSRRAVSFRLPTLSRHELPEAETKSVVERGGESETEAAAAGSCCSNSVASMESQIGETPSFARRTLQWIVNKNNRVGSHGV